MPPAAMKNPSTQAVPASAIDLRGPDFSTQVPPNAAESPRNAMATEKIQPTETSPTSKRDISGILKTLKAYTCPIQRWIANAAAGMNHRLNFLGATIADLSNTLAIVFPSSPCHTVWYFNDQSTRAYFRYILMSTAIRSLKQRSCDLVVLFDVDPAVHNAPGSPGDTEGVDRYGSNVVFNSNFDGGRASRMADHDFRGCCGLHAGGDERARRVGGRGQTQRPGHGEGPMEHAHHHRASHYMDGVIAGFKDHDARHRGRLCGGIGWRINSTQSHCQC